MNQIVRFKSKTGIKDFYTIVTVIIKSKRKYEDYPARILINQ